MGHHVNRHWRRSVGLAAAACLAAGAWAASALAGGYSVHVNATSPVKKGHAFTVKAHGSAAQKAELYIYLDRQACPASEQKEAQRNAAYKSGHSYFIQTGEGGKVRSSWYFAVVNGSFKRSPQAHAGTRAGVEHACAYLLSRDKFGNYLTTAAHAAARYTVIR